MSRKKLLLIDDEDDIREVATLTLETMADFDVITAPNGLTGVAKARDEHPDAILLDVMMPGLDGVSTFMKLQELDETRDIPVIFMTAKVQPADRKRLGDLGAKGIIAKPFVPMTLSNEVLELLSR